MEASAATVFLLVLCLSCLLLLLRGGRRATKARLPPGPRPLPFIGNLPHLDAKNMIKSLLEVSSASATNREHAWQKRWGQRCSAEDSVVLEGSSG